MSKLQLRKFNAMLVVEDFIMEPHHIAEVIEAIRSDSCLWLGPSYIPKFSANCSQPYSDEFFSDWLGEDDID